METGVEAGFHDVCAGHGLDWTVLLPRMRAGGRYHIATG
jgi:hypothetical protein